MEYFQFGNGAKTLVILPGLSVQSVMLSADAIAQAYQPLCEEYTIYVFDRRKETPDPYTVHEMRQCSGRLGWNTSTCSAHRKAE